MDTPIENAASMIEALHKVVSVTACLYLAACTHAPDRENPVGRSVATFEDSDRQSWVGGGNRPLLTQIWYPAVAGVHESAWNIAVFHAGWSALDADITASPKKLPLVVLSHGTGGAAAQLSWLAEILASSGYLVAAVNHHGNTAAEDHYLPHGFALWWERARDISVVIDRLLADPRLGPRIDTARMGAAGFSLGGYTVLAIAGARISRAQWERFCADEPNDPNCRLPPESPFSIADIQRLREEDQVFMASVARSQLSYRDARIRAVYAIAPMLAPALDAQSLAAISIPVRIVVGDKDEEALPNVNARLIAGSVPNAELQLLPDVPHYTFLALCGMTGRLFVRQLCSDPDGRLPGFGQRL